MGSALHLLQCELQHDISIAQNLAGCIFEPSKRRGLQTLLTLRAGNVICEMLASGETFPCTHYLALQPSGTSHFSCLSPAH